MAAGFSMSASTVISPLRGVTRGRLRRIHAPLSVRDGGQMRARQQIARVRAVAPFLAFALAAGGAHAQSDDRAEAAAQAKPRVLVLELERNNVDEAIGDVLLAALVEAMAEREIEVISSADLKQLADLEADRQATGCDTTSCLAEIAGAMGARYVVFGALTSVDDLKVANLSLFDAEQAKPVGRQTIRGESARELIDATPAAADALLVPLDLAPRALASSSAPATQSEGSPLMPVGIGVAAVGGVALVIGAGALAGALVVRQDPSAHSDLKNTADVALLAGGVAAALGLLGAAAGGGLLLFSVLE